MAIHTVSCEHTEKVPQRVHSKGTLGTSSEPKHGRTLRVAPCVPGLLPSLLTRVHPLLPTARGTRRVRIVSDLRGACPRAARSARRGRVHRNRVL